MIKPLTTFAVLATTAALSSILAFSAPASAAPASVDAAPTVRVNLHGIDLASDDGVEIARRKLRAAARQVCPTGFDQRDLQQLIVQRACYNKAIKAAYAQIDQIHLALTRSRNGDQTAMVAQAPSFPSGR